MNHKLNCHSTQTMHEAVGDIVTVYSFDEGKLPHMQVLYTQGSISERE